MFEKLREWLSGGKTYLICASAILTAIIAFINGNMEIADLVKAIFVALTAITLRAGVAKNNPNG